MDAVGVSPQPDPQHGTHQEPGARVRLLAAKGSFVLGEFGENWDYFQCDCGIVAVSRHALLARGSSGVISVIPNCAVWHWGLHSFYYFIIIIALIFKPKPLQP